MEYVDLVICSMMALYYLLKTWLQNTSYQDQIFFRFLQIRDYIFRSTTLVTNPSMWTIEKFLLNPLLSKQISYNYEIKQSLYNALCCYDVENTQHFRRLWEGELQLIITEEDWRQAIMISDCNRVRVIQLRIVQRWHITPLLRSKCNPSNSPLGLCLICKVQWEITPTASGNVQLLQFTGQRLFDILVEYLD